MRQTSLLMILSAALLVGCGSGLGGTDRVMVSGVGAEDMLKLRAGPGLGFNVLLGLPDGTALDRGDCVTEVGQLWCRVSLPQAAGVSGYVAADYLSPSR